MDIKAPNEHERKKNYLKRYKRNGILIARLESKLAAVKLRIETPLKSPGISDMPRGGERITTEDLIADKVDLERRIERLKARGRTLKRETENAIDTLTDERQAEVLELIMIHGLTPEEAAVEMDYSERHVQRLYSEAIDALTLNSQ